VAAGRGRDYGVQLVLDFAETRGDTNGGEGSHGVAEPIRPGLDDRGLYTGKFGQHANVLRPPVPVADHTHPR
jgi:hypothetical protein